VHRRGPPTLNIYEDYTEHVRRTTVKTKQGVVSHCSGKKTPSKDTGGSDTVPGTVPVQKHLVEPGCVCQSVLYHTSI